MKVWTSQGDPPPAPVGDPEPTRLADPAPAAGGDRMLVIDWTRCVGHGVCAAALGERIDLDRWGFPTGVTTRGAVIPGELTGAARLAVATCPAAALRLARTERV